MNHFKRYLNDYLPERFLAHLMAIDHYLNGESTIRLLRRVCQKGKVALDVGANIGTYTYFLSRHASEVYAYEPNPELADRLYRSHLGFSVSILM